MKGKAWTKADERFLAKYFRLGASHAELAEVMERTVGSIKSRLKVLGLVDKNRYLSPEQIETAKANQGKLTAKQIGELIGRTETSVHQLFNRLGLTKKRKKHRGLIGFIRRHHKFGWSDAEISAEWSKQHPDDPLTRRHLGDIRREKCGLPDNALSEHRRQLVAKKTKEQCRQAGVKNLAEVRRLAYNEFARKHGWPDDLRPRAVQICDLLYERGPHTRSQIAAAVGMPWKGSRKSLVSNDPEGSYLAHLQARGLVVQLPRVVKGRGRGKSVHLYAIAPHVRRGVAS
jgi:hypothetical protein